MFAELGRFSVGDFDAQRGDLKLVPVRRRRPEHDLASAEIADGAYQLRRPDFFANGKALEIGELGGAVQGHREVEVEDLAKKPGHGGGEDRMDVGDPGLAKSKDNADCLG